MRADARANRDDILEAAKELFQEQGVTVAFRTVAARAGVGVATLHRHFPDREALINAVADRLHDRATAIIDRYDAVWDRDSWEAWTGIVHGLAALGVAPLAVSASNFAVAQDQVDDFVQVARGRDMQRVQDTLAKAAACGFAPEDLDPRRFVAGIVIVSRPLPDVTAQLVPGQQEWLVDVYIDGLRARAGAARTDDTPGPRRKK